MRVWLHETSHASSQLLSTWLLLSRYTTTRGSTMTKRLCLLGISLRIEECTQCGASSGSSETLGESMWLTFSRSFGCFRSRVSVFSSCPKGQNSIVAQECTSTSRPQRDRPCSALCPHYVRTTPVVFPHRFRSISAIFPHCSRGISTLLLLRSLPHCFCDISAVFPHCSRGLSAVFPHRSRSLSALFPQFYDLFCKCLPSTIDNRAGVPTLLATVSQIIPA